MSKLRTLSSTTHLRNHMTQQRPTIARFNYLAAALALAAMLLGTNAEAAEEPWPELPLSSESLQARVVDARSRDWTGRDALVVYRTQSVDVDKDGVAVRVEEKDCLALTPAGTRTCSLIRLNYDPATSSVKLVSVRVLTAKGEVRTVDISKAQDVPQPAHGIYWPMNMVVLNVAGVEPGDTVSVLSTSKGFEMAYLAESEDRFIPPQRGEFFAQMVFGDTLPVLEQRYQVRISKNKPLQFAFRNGSVASSTVLTGDRLEYRFWASNLPAWPPSPSSQPLSDVAPVVEMSTMPTWHDKSRWFYIVSEPSILPTPEVEAKAREIIASAGTDDASRMAALTWWVANNIRYAGISTGASEGYTIHQAGLTLQDRMGVCKDKAGLLAAMMRSVGYTQTYAAMTAAGYYVGNVPVDVFNHAVVVYFPPAGGHVLLDPTWVPLSRELWSGAEGQQQYLPGTPQGDNLSTTPPAAWQENRIETVVEAELDEQGNLHGTAQWTAYGFLDTVVRRGYGSKVNSLWPPQLASPLKRLGPGATGTSFSLDYTTIMDLSRPISLELKFSIDRFLPSPRASVIAVKPLSFGLPVPDDRLLENVAPTLNTKGPAGLMFRCPKELTFTERITLPHKYELSGAPAIYISTPLGSLSVKVTLSGNELQTSVIMRFTTRVINSSDLASYSQLVDAVAGLAAARVVLVEVSP